MPPFNFLLSFVRSFGTTNSPIEDSDDEAGESMSLSDTTSDASLLEILEAKADVSVSPAARVPTSPTIDYEYPHSPPISPCAIPLDKLTLDEPTIPVTGHYCVRRRVKSTARHCVYSVPSREQRVVFKRHCRRKEMFLEDYCNPVASSESSTLSSAPGPVHATSDTGATAIQKNWFGSHLSIPLASQCSVKESQYDDGTDSAPTPTPPIYATKKSHLTIKIPGLVDRLALRLLSSCNVMEPAEEDFDLDGSLDGHSASESSIDSDNERIRDIPLHPPSSDRLSRRKFRRHATAPYHFPSKFKRKGFWLSLDTRERSEPSASVVSFSTTERNR